MLQMLLEMRVQCYKKLAEEKMILDNKLAYIIGQLSTLNKESQEYKKLAEEYTEILKLKRIYS